MTTWTGEIHPAANLFPMIEDDDYRLLVDDIRANGLIEALWLTKDGALLDGRNRAKACTELNTELKFRVYDGDDPIGFVVSLNLKRRHLTAGQKAMLALEVLSAYEDEGLRKKAEGAKDAGRGRPKEKDEADLPHPFLLVVHDQHPLHLQPFSLALHPRKPKEPQEQAWLSGLPSDGVV